MAATDGSSFGNNSVLEGDCSPSVVDKLLTDIGTIIIIIIIIII